MGGLTVRRAFADVPEGQIHYAVAGEGEPVLLLHQTPRSWDEFRDVLPIVGQRFRAIAMDTVGFGDSYRPAEPFSVELAGRVVIQFLDALGIDRAHVVGHHTGGVVAVEVAATYPARVNKLGLSSTPCVDAPRRERAAKRPAIDHVEFQADGSHLTALWRKRQWFYPPDRPDLLTRFAIDALKVFDRAEEGHLACNRYQMERRFDLIQAPTLILVGGEDQFALPEYHHMIQRLPHAQHQVVAGGMVPLPDQMPEEFARVVLEFLES
ncbi:MAG: alpha/beta fold hydrolase [Chloroflexota bacterium]